MKPNVRPATPGDAATLADLVTQLGYPSNAEQILARMATLTAADGALLVAEVGGAVVGVVHVNRWANVVVDDTAEVIALAVDSQWRSEGIGGALLQEAEQWARQHGCRTLQVRTNIVRQRAHEFYFRHGFHQVKTSLTVVKAL
jgi:N-acetylglutamate synthase-like GNAT family acetyltransferase